MTTESSVVVALREVRRLELERQRREEESRKREQKEQERARAEAAQRASIQYGPGVAPYVNGQGWGGQESSGETYAAPPVRRTAEVVPLDTQEYTEPQGAPMPAPGWIEHGQPFRPLPGRSRVAPVVVTLMVCAAAGAAGYWKMQGEWETKAARLETENSQLEEQRNEAVAARSRAEQDLKVKMADMQSTLTTMTNRLNAAEAARVGDPDGPRPATATGPLPGNRFKRFGPRRFRGGGRAFQGAAAIRQMNPKPANPAMRLNPPPPAPEPKVAKKKTLTDDPLGGLKL